MSLISLETPVVALPRIQPGTVRDLAKLEIHTVRDLLFHFPFRHEDFSRIVPAGKVKIGERATVRAQVLVIEGRRSPRKRRTFTEAIFRDPSGSLKAVWFNQPYLPKILRTGDWVYLSGTLEESYFGVHMTNPVFERIRPGEETVHVGRLVPIYSTAGNLTSRQIRTLVANVLPGAPALTEWLPDSLRGRRGLLPIAEATRAIHFPNSSEELDRARHRLAFDELFAAQLVACHARSELDRETAPAIPFDEAETRALVGSLPFNLTDGQRKAAWEILKDLGTARPMNRLLEGDVGSGKTVVAALAILNTIRAGHTVICLAPTEILARQHAETFQSLFRDTGIHIGLLTAGIQLRDGEPVARAALEKAVRAGEIQLLIGTHTLTKERTRGTDVGLVVIDEQHRFGVEERRACRERFRTPDALPHLLSMTATPIPRTLALTLYGDLDLTILDELPAGRTPVATELVRDAERNRVYHVLREEVRSGRQGFVICPIISESDKLGVRAATRTFEELKTVFPEFSIGLLHGKLKTADKERVMSDFKDGRSELLVATAVVEVGIDVPNATIMLIEGAERFGLAQLHQFRGRIGRGEAKSRCFLFTDTDTTESRERLLTFARTTDGFALAEADLAARGPGELFGTAQSGLPRLRIADIRDHDLLMLARAEAETLLKADPDLTSHPPLREKTMISSRDVHLE